MGLYRIFHAFVMLWGDASCVPLQWCPRSIAAGPFDGHLVDWGAVSGVSTDGNVGACRRRSLAGYGG